MKTRIITDDFTSASDGLAAFAQRGRSCAIALTPSDDGAEAISVDTDSRLLEPWLAAARVRPWAAAWASAEVLIKQFDSTLRGPWLAEIMAARAASGRRRLIIAPAFPAAGRTTRDGIVHVDGMPVAQTAFARDPRTPVKQSSLPLALEAFGVSANVVKVDGLANALASHQHVIVDAQDEAELDALVAHRERVGDVLWCGSTGLVRAFARALAVEDMPPASIPASARRVWICVGSRHPMSLAQRAHAQGTPDEGIVVAGTASAPGDPATQARDLAERVAEAVLAGECEGIVATGGETARRIMRALDVRGVRVLGECAPGIARCELRLRDRQLPFVTKAGGFGETATLLDLARMLRGQTP